MKQHPTITVERGYRNGGRLLGKTLSEEPGIPYYDDKIIRVTSEHAAVGEKYFRLHDEKPGKRLFEQAWDVVGKPRLTDNITHPDNLFRLKTETIRGMADKGSCIFIRRNVGFMFDATESGDLVSPFVYCGTVNRMRRVMEMDGVGASEAMARIRKISRQRRECCRHFTGNNWDDPMPHDLSLNTTHLATPETAELVRACLRLRGLLEA